ncbi:MAG: isochorismatase family protein [Planctomycetota bacterium]|jgi:nicotinamidase-related amidase|nr:isochorismatase family protein [Planctomycetota bacterium]
MYPDNDQAAAMMADAMKTMESYYQDRGIFQDRFGFGKKLAIVVVDFAYGWTDDSYAGGSARLDAPVENTARLLEVARSRDIPIIYTTSPYRPQSGDQPFKSAADLSESYRTWDERACQLDERVAPAPEDLVIEKENASAFFGTHLAAYLIEHGIDTLLITGCSTSACIRSTATDAKSFRFRPVIISDCVGDRSAVAHVFTLADIQARFSDVVSLEETLQHLES